jgi:hypothetical protein
MIGFALVFFITPLINVSMYEIETKFLNALNHFLISSNEVVNY